MKLSSLAVITVFAVPTPVAITAPAQEKDAGVLEVATSPDRLSRCGYRTRTNLDGRADREAVCVFENEFGAVFLISVRVFCDEGCRPVGIPIITEFYE